MSNYTHSTWAVDNPSESRPTKRRRSGNSSEERSSTTPRPPSPRRSPPIRSLAHLLHSPSAFPSPSPLAGEACPSGSLGEDAEDSESDAEGEDEVEDSRPGTAIGLMPDSRVSGGDWTYTLEVIQQPQRARACGFGDKDRRPLSPPPIIRLWVRDANGKLVNPTHVSVHFLVLMVDLWSADGTQQRNVVMHPASSQAAQATIMGRGSMQDFPDMPIAGPSSRPSTGMSQPDAGFGQGSFSTFPGSWRFAAGAIPPPATSPGTSPLSRAHFAEGSVPSPLPIPSPMTGWSGPGSGSGAPHQHPHSQSSRPPFPRTHSHTDRHLPMDPDPTPARPFTAPSPTRLHPSASTSAFQLPSISAVTDRPQTSSASRPGSSHHLTLPALRDTRSSVASSSANTSNTRETRVSWSTESSRGSFDYPPPLPPTSHSHPAHQLSSWAERPRTAGSHSAMSTHQASINRPSTSSGLSFASTSQRYASSESSYGGGYPRTPEPPRIHLGGPAPNYSRVLVGSLTAICQRLHDSTGELGLFFFAHDLGIRTEGVFTLKFSLMNLASLMQGAVISGDRSKVLAQVHSDPFTVYSAKRFPGVIPTTNLTRLFARQNVRLPTRQKRTRGGSAGESGEAEGDDDDQ